jgi:hypothetical protein
METQDRFVNDVEAAKILCLKPQTMRNYRNTGRGPAYYKHGRMVRYKLQDLIEYMNAGRVDPQVRP